MIFDTPAWTMRDLECPTCGQVALQLIACPSCAAVALGCGECSEYFLDLAAQFAAPATTTCDHCGGHTLATFASATSQQIQAAGLTQAQYA